MILRKKNINVIYYVLKIIKLTNNIYLYIIYTIIRLNKISELFSFFDLN